MRKNKVAVFSSGALIGVLGGLIGLGGAEFRLPLLIGIFEFASLEAVILNKTMSLVVVASALPFRMGTIPFSELLNHWTVILNLLAGSLLGAWFGAGWAIRLKTKTLYKVIAVLLVLISFCLLFAHNLTSSNTALFSGITQMIAGVFLGFGIGIVASLLGVAGGELLIPTLVLLFGLDIKLAGSLSLAISLPTMITGFTRYRADKSFAVVTKNKAFVFVMAFGSLVGAFLGGQLVGIVSTSMLLPLLSVILILSAVKVWRHE